MNSIKKAMQRKIIMIALRNVFDRMETESEKIFTNDKTTKLDLFNSGIELNINKVYHRYAPKILETLREIAEKEVKKL